MEKKQIKLSLGTFIFGIIAIILAVVVVIMGIHIANQNKTLEESRIAMENRQDVPQPNQSLQNDIATTTKFEDKTTTILNNKLPTSVIISGYNGESEYLKVNDAYGDDISYYEENERPFLISKYADIYNNKQYYVYEKNKYLGDTIVKTVEGMFPEEIELSYNFREMDYKIQVLVDMTYDAIPRNSKKVELSETIMKNLSELIDYNYYEVENVDLDGDNKYEYIIALQDTNNKTEAKSKIVIVDENGKKISNLVNIQKGYFNGGDLDPDAIPFYIGLDDLTYIDLDNDGQMEIIVHLPEWEGGVNYRVFKYQNNKIIGKTIDWYNLGP